MTPGATITSAFSCFSIRICEKAHFRGTGASAIRLHFRMATYACSDVNELQLYFLKPQITSEAIRAISARGKNPGDANSGSGGRRNNHLWQMGRRHRSRSRTHTHEAGRDANSLCDYVRHACDGTRHARCENNVYSRDARGGDGLCWRLQRARAMPMPESNWRTRSCSWSCAASRCDVVRPAWTARINSLDCQSARMAPDG